VTIFTYPSQTLSITGVATEVTLSAINTKVATETTLAALNAKVTAVNTGAVTVAASALPSGASTEATLSALNAKVTAVDTGAVTVAASALPTGAATETTLSGLNTKVPSNLTVKAASTAAIATDPSLVVALSPNTVPAVTQSGTWNITNVSGTVSLPTGAATSANQSTTNTNLTTINTSIGTSNTSLSTIATNTAFLGIVDVLDTPLFDASSTNIPASASSPLQVVATLAAAVKRIQSVEDIGEFIGIYTGAAASEVLYCVLPLGGGDVTVSIAAGTRISIRNMKNATVTTGNLAINFIG